MTVSKARIDDFLSQKRLAMVGVSRSKRNFSRMLFRDLRKFGYDMVPVHAEANEIEGIPCPHRVQEIEPPVDGVLLMTKPATTETVVEDCREAGIHRVWMYRAIGKGAVSEKAIEYCLAHNIDVVPGGCPYMFIPEAAWLHKLHGFLVKITGAYPR